MEWTRDVSAGDWLRERIDDPWRGTMHDVVPRGFEAYARVFHPASRDRPIGAAWPPQPYSDERAWTAFMERHPGLDIEDERVTWAQTAVALGTTMHPLAQWDALARRDEVANRENDPRDAEGWRYHDPDQSALPTDILASVTRVLSRHTSTPDAGFAALWDGHGGLVGHLGIGPSRAFYQADDDGSIARHNQMLGRSFKDVWNNVFRRPTWQEGILSRDVSEGPRLRLPNRDFVLFSGGVSALTDEDWVLTAPWRDVKAESHGFPPGAYSPSLAWPDDRAWVLVSEIDFDSTIVGGSAELVAALVADPHLEAAEIPEGTALGYDIPDPLNP
ncbi:hypothetical protein [Microbacterium dauci]|uniref:Uncharacterized protein n=1 Tax=Microbacterium dauci TaxID=3048008 RepID=A0ABT6ZD61_9MICO|nr:hypothetical protein [Microbacterium sp. LX3-4]MDJ1114097.1 hypothetical protein [Microbacterium sp. LX3-4]